MRSLRNVLVNKGLCIINGKQIANKKLKPHIIILCATTLINGLVIFPLISRNVSHHYPNTQYIVSYYYLNKWSES